MQGRELAYRGGSARELLAAYLPGTAAASYEGIVGLDGEQHREPCLRPRT